MKTKITVPTYPIICVASVISSATTGICASSMGSSTSGVSLQKCRPWVPSSTRFQNVNRNKKLNKNKHKKNGKRDREAVNKLLLEHNIRNSAIVSIG